MLTFHCLIWPSSSLKHLIQIKVMQSLHCNCIPLRGRGVSDIPTMLALPSCLAKPLLHLIHTISCNWKEMIDVLVSLLQVSANFIHNHYNYYMPHCRHGLQEKLDLDMQRLQVKCPCTESLFLHNHNHMQFVVWKEPSFEKLQPLQTADDLWPSVMNHLPKKNTKFDFQS